MTPFPNPGPRSWMGSHRCRRAILVAAVALVMVLQVQAAEDWPDEAGRLASVLAVSPASL